MFFADKSPTLQVLDLGVSSEFLRIVGIVEFAEIFRVFSFVVPRNTFVAETKLARWRHLTGLES